MTFPDQRERTARRARIVVGSLCLPPQRVWGSLKEVDMTGTATIGTHNALPQPERAMAKPGRKLPSVNAAKLGIVA